MSRKSSLYGAIQTVLLVLFGLAYVRDRSTPIWEPAGLSRTLGTVLCLAGLALLLSAAVTLRRVIQIEPMPRPGGHLVTRGPYARLRHPIYTGILILVLGLFMRQPTWLVVIVGVPVIAYLAIKVRLEEKLLLERYPDYADYRTRTWGLIPGLR